MKGVCCASAPRNLSGRWPHPKTTYDPSRGAPQAIMNTNVQCEHAPASACSWICPRPFLWPFPSLVYLLLLFLQHPEIVRSNVAHVLVVAPSL